MTSTSITRINQIQLQLEKLRRLAQPFFLNLEKDNGLQFVWLLISLIFCVGGLILFGLTVLTNLLNSFLPLLTDKYFSGVIDTVNVIWNGAWGWLITVLFFIACYSFFYVRHQLRNKKWVHWLLLGFIVLMLLGVNGINAGIGFIARDLSNALVEKREEGFYLTLGIYASCFIIALPIRLSQIFITLKLGIIWREWLSKNLISDYMSNQAYYVLNPNDEKATDLDNPDQRITDDTKTFTDQSLQVTVGIFDAILTFALNILILYSISKTLTFSLFSYAAIATSILLVAGRKLVKINYDQLRYEADFRYGLVHIRDNAESIAFYSGEEPEQQESQRRLSEVVKNFNLLIVWKAIIFAIKRSFNYAGNFFPYLIMAVPYFTGEIDYGRFIQANFSFNMVEGSLFFIVNQIDELAKFTAGVSRLSGFQSKVEEVGQRIISPNLENSYSINKDSILIKGAYLSPPSSDKRIINDLNLTIGEKDRVLVVGPSGCGKTSLLRMISGLWKPHQGEIERPKTGDLLFIPQKPYLLLGSLREQLCYPTEEERFSDDQLRSVLHEVKLESLIERYPNLDITQDWTRILSLGEQQRLAFGRLLLNSPRFAVLDEATSALDIKTEQSLYALLKQRDLSFISVGHRPSLIEFHTSVLELNGEGSWRLFPKNDYKFNET